jgi:hypothetical protein
MHPLVSAPQLSHACLKCRNFFIYMVLVSEFKVGLYSFSKKKKKMLVFTISIEITEIKRGFYVIYGDLVVSKVAVLMFF